MTENGHKNDGWILLHRKLLDNPIWKERRVFSKAEAWLDLLMAAQHSKEPQAVWLGTQIIYCNRGETIKSLDTWAMRWGWNKSKVRRVLQLFQRSNMIRTKSETQTTRITICNYDTYNSLRNADETQMKRKRNASETQMTPDNECNECINEKNERIHPPYPPTQNSSANSSAIPNELERKLLGENLSKLFVAWVQEVETHHLHGKAMSPVARELHLKTLIGIHASKRKTALESSIKGHWKNIQMPFDNNNVPEQPRYGITNIPEVVG